MSVEACSVWPDDQPIGDIGGIVRQTIFKDYAQYHDALIARLYQLADEKWGDDMPNSHSIGGRKVHHLDQWECPEAEFLNERAKEFFRRSIGGEEIHVDLSWANLYGKHDYLIPHSHRMSVASLVYFLDLGDPDPVDNESGRLVFVDPRMNICCSEEPEYMTTQCYIEAEPGLMLIWPSKLVHCVTPYAGDRPRITVAWNISRRAGELRRDEPYPNVAPTPTSRVE